jgi:hypothetical protein
MWQVVIEFFKGMFSRPDFSILGIICLVSVMGLATVAIILARKNG